MEWNITTTLGFFSWFASRVCSHN